MAGNLLVDDIVFDDGTTRLHQPGGALLHAALAAAAWGLRVGCVSVVGCDYPPEALGLLRARGISLDGVRTLATPGLRVWLLHEGGVRHMVGRLGGPTHDEVSPAPTEVPAHWRDAGVVHVAPMPFERQRAMVTAFGDGARFVSVDPHRAVDAGSLDAWRAVLASADALFASDDELHLAGSAREALRALAVGRMRYVVHKRGDRGGVLYDARDDALWTWSALDAPVLDVTGAGDAFAAGFVSALHEGRSVAQAIARAASSASVAIEGAGASAMASCTRETLDTRAARCAVRKV